MLRARRPGDLHNLSAADAGGAPLNRIEGYGGSLPPIPSIPKLRRMRKMTQRVEAARPTQSTHQQRRGHRRNGRAGHAGDAPCCIHCEFVEATALCQHERRGTKHDARDARDVCQAWNHTGASSITSCYVGENSTIPPGYQRIPSQNHGDHNVAEMPVEVAKVVKVFHRMRLTRIRRTRMTTHEAQNPKHEPRSTSLVFRDSCGGTTNRKTGCGAVVPLWHPNSVPPHGLAAVGTGSSQD